jgi:hypothetical protein
MKSVWLLPAALLAAGAASASLAGWTDNGLSIAYVNPVGEIEKMNTETKDVSLVLARIPVYDTTIVQGRRGPMQSRKLIQTTIFAPDFAINNDGQRIIAMSLAEQKSQDDKGHSIRTVSASSWGLRDMNAKWINFGSGGNIFSPATASIWDTTTNVAFLAGPDVEVGAQEQPSSETQPVDPDAIPQQTETRPRALPREEAATSRTQLAIELFNKASQTNKTLVDVWRVRSKAAVPYYISPDAQTVYLAGGGTAVRNNPIDNFLIPMDLCIIDTMQYRARRLIGPEEKTYKDGQGAEYKAYGPFMSPADSIAWSRDGKSLYVTGIYSTTRQTMFCIWRVDAATGERALRHFTPFGSPRPYAVTVNPADGRVFFTDGTYLYQMGESGPSKIIPKRIFTQKEPEEGITKLSSFKPSWMGWTADGKTLGIVAGKELILLNAYEETFTYQVRRIQLNIGKGAPEFPAP